MAKRWLAVVGWVPTAYGIARGILDLVGNVDVILDHIPGHDTTWLGKATGYLLTAPIYVVLPVTFIGLVLIYWDFHRNPKVVHHHSATVGLTGVQAVASAGTLTPVSPQALPDSSREFVPRDVTAIKLMALFDNQTNLNAIKQVETYYGKWLPVTGKVGNVFGGKNRVSVGISLTRERFIMCDFALEREFQVAHLVKGVEVSVVGKISHINYDHIILGECEVA